MKSVIRQALRGDVPALTSVIRTAFHDVAERFGLTADNCPKHPSNCEPTWVEDALARGVCYFVAESKGAPVGCVALAHARPGVCYLERLAVVPAHRSKGLGTALTRRALTEAKAWGADRVEIGVIAGHTDLVEWYEKRGFETLHTARFPHLPFDVLFMAASLQGNAPGGSPHPISSSARGNRDTPHVKDRLRSDHRRSPGRHGVSQGGTLWLRCLIARNPRDLALANRRVTPPEGT